VTGRMYLSSRSRDVRGTSLEGPQLQRQHNVVKIDEIRLEQKRLFVLYHLQDSDYWGCPGNIRRRGDGRGEGCVVVGGCGKGL
jgi:hypothetical protein